MIGGKRRVGEHIAGKGWEGSEIEGMRGEGKGGESSGGEIANVYSKFTAIIPISINIVEISFENNKFSFTQDQFTRIFSYKVMLCNSIRSYFDNGREETSDRAKQNSICFVEKQQQIRLPACVQ